MSTNTNVVIIDQTNSIDPTLIANTAVALNVQAQQHLAKFWTGINASVSSAASISAMPLNAWPIFLVESLPPDEGGFHLDKKNQPYAKVIASPKDSTWTIDASHEMCEMLVDPYGNKMQSSEAIVIEGDGVIDTTGTFDYLVEVCDPCEANDFAYEISGIAVSDFITPNYYDAGVRAGVQYSFMSNIKRPRELLKGGYISYSKPDGSWEQILWVNSGNPTYKGLSSLSDSRSWREAVHAAMGNLNADKRNDRHKGAGWHGLVKARIDQYRDRDPKSYESLLRQVRGWSIE